MATDDATLATEVREQTGMTDAAVLSDSRLSALLANAKREIATVIEYTPDWYVDIHAESALFWLTCLFVRGEDETDGFEIAELRFTPSDAPTDSHPWEARYIRSLNHLRQTDSLFVHGKVNRSEREARDYMDGSGDV